MAKYRKKPVIIEAIQWTGNISPDIQNFLGTEIVLEGKNLVINTLEGVMHARPGDYIIRGVKEEFYPCKPDVFKITYELAEPEVENKK